MNIRSLAFVALAVGCVFLGGCSAIATKTNSLTDADILSKTSGVLGLSPSDLTLVNRRTEGVNTYATIKANSGKTYACTVNGGNLLSFGMTNPPVCNPM